MWKSRPAFPLSLLRQLQSFLELAFPLGSKDSFKTLVHPSGQTFCLSSES